MVHVLRNDWFGAYAPYPKDLVVPESFTHPAKLPPSLMFRILSRLEELGLKRGGKILDPFAGIGGTLLCGGLLGYGTFGMELEPKFVSLTEQNIAKNKHKFKFQPVIKQGDSRKDLLSTFGGERFAAVVGSPDFAGTGTKENAIVGRNKQAVARNRPPEVNRTKGGEYRKVKQGISPGQMANLPEGDFQAVISSPPYADLPANDSQRESRHEKGDGAMNRKTGYGKTEGQLERLPEGDFSAVVSSPPYENEIGRDRVNEPYAKNKSDYIRGGKSQYTVYGKSEGQLNEETYWSACRRIYENCFLLLKSGGFIALVVKDFVRKKKRVPLCDQTWELLQAVGFKPVERNRAWLVEEREAATFFDEKYTVKRERKGFFRRLAEKKGSPKIDWEEILICKKP